VIFNFLKIYQRMLQECGHMQLKKFVFWKNYDVPKIQSIMCPNLESLFMYFWENDHFDLGHVEHTTKRKVVPLI
jgi:hypothetical protein